MKYFKTTAWLLAVIIAGCWGPIQAQEKASLTPTHKKGVAMTGNATCVAFSPDGKRVAAGGGYLRIPYGWLAVWDVKTKKQLFVRHLRNQLRCITFSPDGKLLVSGGHADHLGPDREMVATLRFWDITADKQVDMQVSRTGIIMSLAFAPDGKTLATSPPVRIWELATHKEIATFEKNGMSVQFIPYGDSKNALAVYVGGSLRIRNVGSGKKPTQIPTPGARKLCVSPNGKFFASAHYGKRGMGTVKVWDAATGKEIAIFRHARQITAVAFGPNSRTLATGCVDKVVRIWDAATRKEISSFKGHKGYAMNFAFSPDGKVLASAGVRGTVKLWQVPALSKVPD